MEIQLRGDWGGLGLGKAEISGKGFKVVVLGMAFYMMAQFAEADPGYMWGGWSWRVPGDSCWAGSKGTGAEPVTCIILKVYCCMWMRLQTVSLGFGCSQCSTSCWESPPRGLSSSTLILTLVTWLSTTFLFDFSVLFFSLLLSFPYPFINLRIQWLTIETINIIVYCHD